MRQPPSSPTARFAAVLLALACSAVRAEPEAGQAPPTPRHADAVLQLLQERGLLPDAAQRAGAHLQGSPLVQQVRDKASELVLASMNFLGVRYRRGGDNAEHGFDCSGFTRYVFEHSIGLVLPRRSDEQAQTAGLAAVKREELRPGDLVFFNTMRRAFSHVGIYIGEGKFIHAPRSGGAVRIESMQKRYWANRFNGARRVDPASVSVRRPDGK